MVGLFFAEQVVIQNCDKGTQINLQLRRPTLNADMSSQAFAEQHVNNQL